MATSTVPHPIPYQGSKRALAGSILNLFPQKVQVLYEPFAGSAAISLAAASQKLAKRFCISDKNDALARLWSAIIEAPQSVADDYEKIWSAQFGRELDYYNEVRDRFNSNGSSSDFLFLLTRCVKASVRYNQKGEFNQSPDKRRFGTNPEKMRRSLHQASRLLKGKAAVECLDYTEATKSATPADLIYFDPPYQGVSGKRDARYCSGVELGDFVEHLSDLNRRGLSYILSYDGRTGEKTYGMELPDSLRLKRLEIEVGRSSQATLLGRNEITVESLYLSQALLSRLTLLPSETVSLRGSGQNEVAPSDELLDLFSIEAIGTA